MREALEDLPRQYADQLVNVEFMLRRAPSPRDRRRLGLGKSHVAYLVKQGKLKAVRTKVGTRQCWRIDVSSATCGRQADLLDQMEGVSTSGVSHFFG